MRHNILDKSYKVVLNKTNILIGFSVDIRIFAGVCNKYIYIYMYYKIIDIR